MSSSGGVGHESDETTSYVLQPPRPPQSESGAGRLIAGRYRLLAKLGHGGMGTVWRAQDETVDREVAVKEPRVPDHLPERERGNAFERMRREARAAARLDHPSVVNVHDVAVVDGRPWIVMELVRGRSLGDALQEGTLGAREAARIGLEVLGALEAAHAAGILHRDVKPDNILLGRHDRVVLTDFGIAQIEGETNLTDTGGFVGSPPYDGKERRGLHGRPDLVDDDGVQDAAQRARRNGDSPLRAVQSSAPSDHRSASGPVLVPDIRSGAVYSGEPTKEPVSVSVVAPATWAMPKSVRTTRPVPDSTRTLAGLMSRCSTPAWCAARSALSRSAPIRAASRASTGPSAEIRSAREPPSINSMTM